MAKNTTFPAGYTLYTIVVSLSGVVVMDGKQKGSRLKYAGGGIEVYVRGAVSLRQRDSVHYHAMSLARAHHIPLTQFISYGWV